MPNPDYDPSLHTNVPVELTQPNNDMRYAPVPAPAPVPVPALVPAPVELDSSGYNNVRLNSPNPPAVSYETKPHLTLHDSPVELAGVVVQPSTSSTTTPTDSPSIPRVIWGGELGVNYPNTSSVLTQNNSVPSNINELGGNTSDVSVSSPTIPHIDTTGSKTNSMLAQNGHNSNNSLISSLDTNSSQNTLNSSMVTERGSMMPVRENADDFLNIWEVHQPVEHATQVNNPVQNPQEIGYLAPTPVPYEGVDYTERALSGDGLFSRIKVGIKSIDNKVVLAYVKYHDISKRKIYWNLWEKTKSRYDTYEDFKANWDADTPIWKTMAKEFKVDIKNDVKDILGIDIKRGKPINGGVTRGVEDLLRKQRPFNR